MLKFRAMKALACLLSAVLALPCADALAQGFPERPVQIITPYAAGGGLDILTRAVAQRLATLWGRPVIVENRPGAGSTVGTAAAAKAPKDGYTLLVASTPLGVAPAVYAKLPYDARKDFTPVVLVAGTPEVLVVNPSLGVKDLSDFRAKSKERKMNFGSAGSGTLAHLSAEAVNRVLDLGGTHVPYKGSNPALTDLIGGQIDWVMDTPAAVLPQVHAGKLRALAVAAGERSAQLKDIPTFAEQGYPELDFRVWMGLMAPAGTPAPVVHKIEQGVLEALRQPAFRNTLASQGWDVIGKDSKDFATFLEVELPKLRDAAKAAGVKAD